MVGHPAAAGSPGPIRPAAQTGSTSPEVPEPRPGAFRAGERGSGTGADTGLPPIG